MAGGREWAPQSGAGGAEECAFKPGDTFFEDGKTWKVVAVKQKLPDGYQRSKLCAFYYDVEEHPDGLSVEECEWTPVKELSGLVKVEQLVSDNFSRTLEERAKTVTTHALMKETRAAAGWERYAFDETAMARIDNVYKVRSLVLGDAKKKTAVTLIMHDILDLFGIVLKKMQDQLKASNVLGRRRRRDPAADFLKEVKVSVLPKLLVWLKNLLLLAGFVETSTDTYTPGRPDAVKRLLRMEHMKSFSNALMVPAFFSKEEIDRANEKLRSSEQIPTTLIDPFKATDSVIYDVGAAELGEGAIDTEDERRRLFPSYILRQKLVDNMLGAVVPPDPRVKHFTTVEEGIKFEVKVKPIVLSSYAACGGYPHTAGADLTITYAIQRAYRRTPGRTPMAALFSSLLSAQEEHYRSQEEEQS
mmetsp:Transcript_27039/g.82999  ORF Transcript_27039/g.82999 Transcript_27039/m.82999 type:complete len:416 (+) Transcript_27039:3-1250(+)